MDYTIGLLMLLALLFIFHKNVGVERNYIIALMLLLLIVRRSTVEGYHDVSAVPTDYIHYMDKGVRLDKDHNTWVVNNFGVDGDQLVKGSLNVDSDIMVHRDLAVDGNSSVKGTMDVHNGLAVDGETMLNNDLKVLGGVRIGSTLDVEDNAVINGNLGTGGNHIVNGNFATNGVGTFERNLGVVGNTMIKGKFTNQSNAEFQKDVDISNNLRVHGQVGSGVSKDIKVVDNQDWGSVIDKKCPPNHFMCGVKVRHEDWDRTKNRNPGMFGMWINCCPFK